MDIEPPASPTTDPPPAASPTEAPNNGSDRMEVDMREISEDSSTEADIEAAKAKRFSLKMPDLKEKYRKVRQTVDTFQLIASMGDLGTIYRNRPIWVMKSAKELVEPALDVLKVCPAACGSVLHYTGLLIHEHTNLYFSEKESNISANYDSVQSAALSLINVIRETAEDSLEPTTLEILSWCCLTTSDLSRHNRERPAIKRAAPRSGILTPEIFYSTMNTSPVVSALISVLNYCITKMLELKPKDCMKVLFDGSKFGVHFYWIWHHISLIFSSSIVEHFFSCGTEQFKSYVAEIQAKDRLKGASSSPILGAIHEEYNLKLSALSQMFDCLMRRENIDLKNLISEQLNDCLDNFSSANRPAANTTIVFLFKLITFSVDTMRSLLTQNIELLTPINIYRGMKQIQAFDKSLILRPQHGNTYVEFVRLLLNALDPQALGTVLTALMRMLLDPNCAPAMYLQDQTLKEGVKIALNDVINLILKAVTIKDSLNAVDFPAAASFATAKELQFLLESLESHPDCDSIFVRYLFAITEMFGEQKGGEIAARMLLTSNSKKMITLFCAYLTTVTPAYPNIMKYCYSSLMTIRQQLLCFKPGRKFHIDGIMISNLCYILEGERSEAPATQALRLDPGPGMGPLLSDILKICADHCLEALLIGETMPVLHITSALVRLLKAISYPQKQGYEKRSISMQIRYCYPVALLLAAVQIQVLRTVCKRQAQEDAIGIFEQLRTAIYTFYTENCHEDQAHFVRDFVRSFIIGCLMNSEELFGEKIDFDQWNDDNLDNTLLDEFSHENYSFMEAISHADIKKRIVHLANSGVFAKSVKRVKQKEPLTDDQHLRTYMFLDAVRSFCSGDINHAVLHTNALAQLLLDSICKDAISADFLFQDWEVEKDNVFRYQVVQRLSGSSIIYGLLSIVAETKPCLWICLPLIRVQLADFLTKFVNASIKTELPSVELLKKVDRWITLARKGELIPQRYELIMEILPQVNMHEGFMILFEFWKYFQRRSLTRIKVENAVQVAIQRQSGEGLLQDEYEDKFEIIRLIIQKHLKRFAHLFPLFFPDVIEELENLTDSSMVY